MNINDQFPSKYLKADDLGGATPTVTIKDVIVEEVGDDKRPVIYFVGKEKGVVLNKTNATNIAETYGPDTDEWTGKKVTLYTAWVDFQGKSMEAIRIRRPDAHPAQPSAAVPPQFNEPGDPGFPGDIEF